MQCPRCSYKWKEITEQFDYEALYKAFPRKRGKSQGLRVARKTIKSRAQYESCLKAIENFNLAMKKENREKDKIMYFGTFMGQWTDWLQPEEETPDVFGFLK